MHYTTAHIAELLGRKRDFDLGQDRTFTFAPTLRSVPGVPSLGQSGDIGKLTIKLHIVPKYRILSLISGSQGGEYKDDVFCDAVLCSLVETG
jgi:hypothetical protein